MSAAQKRSPRQAGNCGESSRGSDLITVTLVPPRLHPNPRPFEHSSLPSPQPLPAHCVPLGRVRLYTKKSPADCVVYQSRDGWPLAWMSRRDCTVNNMWYVLPLCCTVLAATVTQLHVCYMYVRPCEHCPKPMNKESLWHILVSWWFTLSCVVDMKCLPLLCVAVLLSRH